MGLQEVMAGKTDEELFSIIENEYSNYTIEALNAAYEEIERREIEVPVWYYKNIEGQQTGPLKRQEIFHLIETDVITASTLIWRKGLKFWVAAGKEGLLSNCFIQKVKNSIQSDIKSDNSIEPPPFMADNYSIRLELQKYKKFRDVQCLECGYSGLMGVVKEKKAWYMFWPIKIILALLCYSLFKVKGIIGALVIVAIFTAIEESTKKTYISCPNCKRTLGPI